MASLSPGASNLTLQRGAGIVNGLGVALKPSSFAWYTSQRDSPTASSHVSRVTTRSLRPSWFVSSSKCCTGDALAKASKLAWQRGAGTAYAVTPPNPLGTPAVQRGVSGGSVGGS